MTSLQKYTAITASAVLGVFLGFGHPAQAATTTATFTAEQPGGEVKPGDGFIVNVRAGALPLPVSVTITSGASLPAPLPAPYTQSGDVYSVAVDGPNQETKTALPLWLKVPVTPQANVAFALLGYDSAAGTWKVIGGSLSADNLISGATALTHTTVVAAARNFGVGIVVNGNAKLTRIPVRAGTTKITTSFANFTLRPQGWSEAGTFIITPDQDLPAALPTGYQLRSMVAFVGFGSESGNTPRMNAGLVVQSTLSIVDYHAQEVLYFNPKNGFWEHLHKGTIYVPGYIAVVDDLRSQYGVASWFPDRRDYVAANNVYPMGTKLRVTNVENGKSTVVKVVSRGPYVKGRVIDLDYTPFKQIRGKNGGLAIVTVTAVDPKVLGESVSKPPTSATASSGVVLPTSSAAAAVYNVDKNVLVAEKNGSTVRPMASLTKLMTALVYLDRNPTFKNLVTYQASDAATCACLYLKAGETVTAGNLWNAMLVGSANNATRALVRSTKLTTAQFVQLMNDKAQALGLSSLHYVEPTGLDPANRGSAADLAKLAAIAFRRPEISQATTQTSYSFSTINTQVAHTIKNQNKILQEGWTVTGTKTGFLYESGYCLITQVLGKTTGRTIVSVILGAATATKEYEDTEKAIDIGFANLQ